MGLDTCGTEGYLTGEDSGSEWGEEEEEEEEEEAEAEEERECGSKNDFPIDGDVVDAVCELVPGKHSRSIPKARRLHKRGEPASEDGSVKW